jgi:glycosyltransferase involved in cell wall biosynthesis
MLLVLAARNMKIGLYLENANRPDLDFRFPDKGNPGSGFTQYAYVALPYYMDSLYPASVEFALYANHEKLLPPSLEAVRSRGPVEALNMAAHDGCDIFVYRPNRYSFAQGIIEAIAATDIKVVAWAQNFLSLGELDQLERSPKTRRVVFVGDEQLDVLRDHPIFSKSSCIYNFIDPALYCPTGAQQKKGNMICFLGSLMPGNSFHVLAKSWPEIKRRVPGARLVVIGSAGLYGCEKKLGPWLITEEAYERDFIRPYLVTTNGEIDPSVEFLGVLGPEKVDILREADVGVVNPSGVETFCVSAVEFQAAGVPVVSKADWGLLTTVAHKRTGLLGRSEADVGPNVVRLLRNRRLCEIYGSNGRDFVQERFHYERACYEWLRLFREVSLDEPNQLRPIGQKHFYRQKYIREALRLLKRRYPSLREVPPLLAVGRMGVARALIRCSLGSLSTVRLPLLLRLLRGSE